MAYFQSACDTTADFGTITQSGAETVAVSSNIGYIGNSMKVVTTTTTSNEISFRKDLTGSTVRILQFRYRLDTPTTISTTVDHNLVHMWSSTTAYSTDFLDFRIIGTNAGANYTIRLVDPVNAYATSVGTTNLTFGIFYKFTIRITDSTYYVYLDENTTPEITATGKTSSGLYIKSVAFGKYYSNSLAATFYFDGIYADPDMGTAASTISTKATDAINGWFQRFYSKDGSYGTIVRPNSEGSSVAADGNRDVVDEGTSYGALFAVQNNDQSRFDAIENWVTTKLNRSNNGALTTGLSLAGYHYNPSAGGTVMDWNTSADGTCDRLLALIFAHFKWGSGGSINYLSRALTMAQDLKTYHFRSYAGLQYLCGDIAQASGATPEFNISYMNPIVFRMLRLLTSDQFWDQAIQGCYAMLNAVTGGASAFTTTKGLPPNWNDWTPSTNTYALPSRGGRDTNYTYDAIRTVNRFYLDYALFDEPQAKTWLAGNLYTFFNSEWTTNAKICAEYSHTGTALSGGYEKAMMYAQDVLAFYAQGNTTTGDTIYNAKVANYTQHPAGSYLNEATYYGGAWELFGVMAKEGLFKVFGNWKYSNSQGFY